MIACSPKRSTANSQFKNSYVAIVTSTSTPASILMIICFTTSVGAFKLGPVSAIFPYTIFSIFRTIYPGLADGSRPNLLNQPFMYPHLICIPRLTAFTARCLPRRDLQAFGRQPDGALDSEILRLGSLDQFLAYFL